MVRSESKRSPKTLTGSGNGGFDPWAEPVMGRNIRHPRIPYVSYAIIAHVESV